MPKIHLATPSIEAARRAQIDVVCNQLHIKLKKIGANEYAGPCPQCGGTDRFSINTAKQVFNCRHCKKGGDVIELVMFADGIDFRSAVEKITGSPPPKANGHDATANRRVANSWIYRDANSTPYLKI
jgi:DNA primase